MEDVSKCGRLHLLRGHFYGHPIQDITYGQGSGRGLFRRESDESSGCQDHDKEWQEKIPEIREELEKEGCYLNFCFHASIWATVIPAPPQTITKMFSLSIALSG